ncbi:MAG: 16S rRNA (cytosine(1402)-N(4))-methyltransferase RsmH [Chloroherpetonaceae bacterium]|nr:16S rRNA (cytosine(1402)-N(4))-methyltransferase RsmH [Chloroherpetonaceae bacterium]
MTYHIPALLNECLEGLVTRPGIYIDGTLGGGGHTEGILQKLENNAWLSDSKIFGIDQDCDAIAFATQRLKRYLPFFESIETNFSELQVALPKDAIETGVQGILLDLGVSFYQFDRGERGFSFRSDHQLDMRMSVGSENRASDIIATYSEKELAEIFWRYGEEPKSRQIAKRILEARRIAPIETTGALAGIVKSFYPEYKPAEQTKAMARVFQALRIEVNDELEALQKTLKESIALLKPGGRIGVISYHSLEDRIVKNFMKDLSTDDWGEKRLPIREPIRKASLKLITKKPLVPSDEEIARNSRSRSAKLRIAEKI